MTIACTSFTNEWNCLEFDHSSCNHQHAQDYHQNAEPAIQKSEPQKLSHQIRSTSDPGVLLGEQEKTQVYLARQPSAGERQLR